MKLSQFSFEDVECKDPVKITSEMETAFREGNISKLNNLKEDLGKIEETMKRDIETLKTNQKNFLQLYRYTDKKYKNTLKSLKIIEKLFKEVNRSTEVNEFKRKLLELKSSITSVSEKVKKEHLKLEKDSEYKVSTAANQIDERITELKSKLLEMAGIEEDSLAMKIKNSISKIVRETNILASCLGITEQLLMPTDHTEQLTEFEIEILLLDPTFASIWVNTLIEKRKLVGEKLRKLPSKEREVINALALLGCEKHEDDEIFVHDLSAYAGVEEDEIKEILGKLSKAVKIRYYYSM